MKNIKKFYLLLVLILVLVFSNTAYASLTFTANAITGTTASTIDLGSGNGLSIQTTGNGTITTGSGLVTTGGSLSVTGSLGIGTIVPSSALSIVGNLDFGPGVASPVSRSITGNGSRATTDTNVAGGNLTISSGTGTGNATGSSLIFQTPIAVASGTGVQTQTIRAEFAPATITIGGAGGSSNSITGAVVLDSTGGNLQTLGANNAFFWDDTNFYSDNNNTIGLGKTGLGWKNLYLSSTNTATVGNVTINRASGRVNMAAAATSVVVTNTLVSTTSHVLVTRSTADATCFLADAIPASGSFTINATAACTANTSFDFVVINN